jgi:hypothetical protein
MLENMSGENVAGGDDVADDEEYARLVEVRRENGPVVALAYVDDEMRFWAYAPETGDFRRNDALFRDYFANDSRYEYQRIDRAAALELVSQGIGASHPRMLDDLLLRESIALSEVLV